MRLPDWLFRRLGRVYLDERQRRDRVARERMREQDRRIRYFYDWARTAHQLGQCFPGCPFAGHGR